MLHWLWIF